MLQFDQVVKRYPDPLTGRLREVLRVGRFEMASGEHVALRGASGSGKTTFLHLCSGLLAADSGTITVQGTAITSLSEPERDRFRASTIGYVFQSFHLLGAFTALENVLMAAYAKGDRPDRAAAEAVLESVGLADRMHHPPGALSVGQQQRVCIARALFNNPSVILADEPTGSLDPATAAEVMDLLQARSEGRTLVLVTHDPAIAASFPRTVDLAEVAA